MSVVGFDIGYQTCLLGCPRGGGIEVLANEYSLRPTPTIVSFAKTNRVLGEGARQNQVMNFRNTIAGFKHLIGRQYKDADVQKELSTRKYNHLEMPDGTVGFRLELNGEEKVVSAVQVMAMMLGKLKTISEAALETKLADCVIGVPCYFSDSQRHALLDASRIAGLNCLRLFNETTAVALAYGIYKQDLPAEGEKPRRVVFVDMGHSQLQLSCVEFVKGKLTVLATKHVPIGGRDLDLVLIEHFCADFKERYNLDVKSNKRACIRLEVECEKLKQLMSANSTSIPINIECLMEDRDVSGRMSREEFETLAAPVLQNVESAVHEFVSELAALIEPITVEDIFAIEIVGGSSRVPAVKRFVQEAFGGRELSTTLNADEAVARGCALQGAIISPTFRVRDFSIVDRQYYEIQLNWPISKTAELDDEEEKSGTIYAANSKASVTKVISFNRDAPFELVASYGNPAVVPGGESLLGTFKINDVTPAYDGSTQKVKVKLKLSEHGTFHIDSATLYEKLQVAEEAEPVAMETDEATPVEASPAAAEGAAPMETDSKPEEGGDAPMPDVDASPVKETEDKEPIKKKAKTTKSKHLSVVEVKPKNRTEQEIQLLIEAELEFATIDRVQMEKSYAKNALEEYIYDIREKLHTIYDGFSKETDREEYGRKLTEFEDWLYDEGEDQAKRVYEERLGELKSFGDKVKMRYTEDQSRPAALEALQRTVVRYEKFLAERTAGDEKYDHLDQADVDKVSGWVQAKRKWLNDMTAAQSALSKHDDPAVKASELNAKATELEALCSPIVNKIKPPPPKAEEPAPAPAAEAEAPAGEEHKVGPEDEVVAVPDEAGLEKANSDPVGMDLD